MSALGLTGVTAYFGLPFGRKANRSLSQAQPAQRAGFDAAIDHKSEDVQARLKELCPKEIDIFFDNVDGEHPRRALARLAMRGRIVLCGAIAVYNATEPPPGPKTYLNLIVQRARIEGFIVLDYMPRCGDDWRARRLGTGGQAQEQGRPCSIAWKTRRRRCGGCSKVATRQAAPARRGIDHTGTASSLQLHLICS